MKDNHGHREHLGKGEWTVAVFVDVGSEEEEREVDEDGASIFDYEDSEPGDLWAWERMKISIELGAE